MPHSVSHDKLCIKDGRGVTSQSLKCLKPAFLLASRGRLLDWCCRMINTAGFDYADRGKFTEHKTDVGLQTDYTAVT